MTDNNPTKLAGTIVAPRIPSVVIAVREPFVVGWFARVMWADHVVSSIMASGGQAHHLQRTGLHLPSLACAQAGNRSDTGIHLRASFSACSKAALTAASA